MPSHSKKQHNFMEAIAHSPSFAKKVHIPQSVGKDYAAADKGKTFSKGGDMKRMAEGGMSEKDMKENEAYRKKREYYGYEDYTPSGRAAIRHYNDVNSDNPKDYVKQKYSIPYDPVAAKKAQAVQREVMNEGRRETRGTVPAAALKKGGEVKESKAMTAKEVAFMKKKGAPKSMIKHEMTEMKRGGKVRRMAAGGTGDPFELSDTDRENYAKNGAENLKRLKGFFGFGDKEDGGTKPSRVETSSSVAAPVAAAPAASTAEVKPPRVTKTEDVQKPTFSGTGSFEDNAPSQRETSVGTGASGFGQTPYKDSGFSALSKKPPVKRQKPVTVSETKETKSVTAAPSDTSYASMEERRALNKKPATKRSFGTANLTEEERAANREAVSGFFGKIGKGLKDMYNMETPAERRSRERKIKEEETHMAKGGKVKKMRYGGDTGMDMGQPMRGMAPRGNPMPAMSPEMAPRSHGFQMPPKQVVKTAPAQMVKKMAEGGYTKADGVASRGKTQPKMVKMAGGGFVKSADGCAQRGKTKAFQVKMNRGGMC